MPTNTIKQLLFKSAIATVVVICVLAILRSPLDSMLFDASGLRWPSVIMLLAVEVVFVSILLSDREATRTLVIKTTLFSALVLLFVTGTGLQWMGALLGQATPTLPASGHAVSTIDISRVSSFLSIPEVMLVVFGIWFFRTALWPALSR